jgi:DNA-directed RNA polymerase subunit K/omega
VVNALNETDEEPMVKCTDGMNAFEFAVLSGLRATQLYRGCTPRVPPSEKVAVTAQHEVAERHVVASAPASSAEPVE